MYKNTAHTTMPTSRILRRDDLTLQTLYEHNYCQFRLILPDPPPDDGWYALLAPGRPAAYLRRLDQSRYTGDWQLGHYYPHKTRRRFAPDYRIRIYHDARLAEARLELDLPLRELRAAKFAHNRALAEWLDYCRRHQYRLHGTALTAPFNIA